VGTRVGKRAFAQPKAKRHAATRRPQVLAVYFTSRLLDHQWASPLVHLQVFHEYRGEFALLQRAIDRCIALVDQVGEPRSVAHMWGNQAELAYCIGDWSLARTAIERSLEVVRAYDLGAVVPETQGYLAQLYLVAGEQEQAETLGAEPLATVQEKHDLQALRFLYSMIAERDLLAGDAHAVRTYLEPLLDRPGLVEYQVLYVFPQYVFPQYAWALLALGDEAEAEARARQSCERARALQYRLFLVDGLRVPAMVRLRQVRWEEARTVGGSHHYCAIRCPIPTPRPRHSTSTANSMRPRVSWSWHTRRNQAALLICERLGEGLYQPHIKRELVQVKPGETEELARGVEALLAAAIVLTADTGGDFPNEYAVRQLEP
jgi:hypothetical protein